MANSNNNQSNNLSKPRSGFSATEFIKKQLERKKTADATQPVSEVVSFPITNEPQSDSVQEKEKKPERDIVEVMNQYLAAAEEHLSSGAVWEAVGVYRAILKFEPDNLQVQQLLVDILLKSNAKPDAIKELYALAELYQKQNNATAVKQTYQKIIELDPENQIAHSALGIPKEEEVIPEIVPTISQQEIYPVLEPEPVAVSASDSLPEETSMKPAITEPTTESTPAPTEKEPTEPEVPVSLEPPTEKADGQMQEPPAVSGEQPVITDPDFSASTDPISNPSMVAERKSAEPDQDLIPEATNGKLEYYRKVLDTDPRNINARLGYINAYLEIGLEFELVPEYLSLAEAYLDLGDLDSAEKAYRHILTLEPDQALAMQGLVAISKLRNEPTSAETPPPVSHAVAPEKTSEEKLIDNYRRILQLNPLNAEIAHRLVAIYKNRGQLDLAITELQYLGNAYIRRSMYAQAMDIYNEAIEIDPKNQEVLQKLEKAKELQQSMTAIDSAIKSYKSGLDFGPIKRS